ncbi:MAG TPA: hypothetical protein VEW48_25555 [Thermoanaerobaculia bacterium]|nr:hypothetical protein [Thermoanaerobaculia bacterium]
MPHRRFRITAIFLLLIGAVCSQGYALPQLHFFGQRRLKLAVRAVTTSAVVEHAVYYIFDDDSLFLTVTRTRESDPLTIYSNSADYGTPQAASIPVLHEAMAAARIGSQADCSYTAEGNLCPGAFRVTWYGKKRRNTFTMTSTSGAPSCSPEILDFLRAVLQWRGSLNTTESLVSPP